MYTRTQQGIVWPYRLVLNRDPDPAELALQSAAVSPRDLCRTLMNTREFEDQLYRPRAPDALLSAGEAEDAVRWAFQLVFGREVDNPDDIKFMASTHATLAALRNTLLFSEEFRDSGAPMMRPLQTLSALWEFRPCTSTAAADGSFNDFLGTSTRCAFLPPHFGSLSGGVQGVPGLGSNPPLHDAAEWVGTLRAVLEARDRLTVVELGAGWAPWLVAAHAAGRKRRLPDIRLLGVEGSAEHIVFIRQHFRDNGLDPDQHRILHGAVAAADGIARFPRLSKPDEDYGAAAAFDAAETPGKDTYEIPCWSVATLLKDLPPIVDLIHCDVQGAEADVLAAAMDELDKRVRRMVIGTHGRAIEGRLLEQFSSRGWRLEHETTCTYRQLSSGALVLLEDGVQVWRSARL